MDRTFVDRVSEKRYNEIKRGKFLRKAGEKSG
jgi:hypothetical protein